MTHFKRFGLALLLAGFMAPASAITIGVNSPASVGENSPYQVDVVVSGLTAANEIIAGFSLGLTYNAAQLNFNSINFGSSLGNPALFEALTFSDGSTDGSVTFNESSLLPDANLDALQGDSFTLATLLFTSEIAGVSPLTLSINDLTGRNATAIVGSTTLAQGGVTVGNGNGNVPVPQSFYLFGLGLLMLRRKNWNLLNVRDS